MKGLKLLHLVRKKAREAGAVGPFNRGNIEFWRTAIATIKGRRQIASEDVNYDLFERPYKIHTEAIRSSIQGAVNSNLFSIKFNEGLNVEEIIENLGEIMKDKLRHLNSGDKVKLTISSLQLKNGSYTPAIMNVGQFDI